MRNAREDLQKSLDDENDGVSEAHLKKEEKKAFNSWHQIYYRVYNYLSV